MSASTASARLPEAGSVSPLFHGGALPAKLFDPVGSFGFARRRGPW
jgi:hypothetical protein